MIRRFGTWPSSDVAGVFLGVYMASSCDVARYFDSRWRDQIAGHDRAIGALVEECPFGPVQRPVDKKHGCADRDQGAPATQPPAKPLPASGEKAGQRHPGAQKQRDGFEFHPVILMPATGASGSEVTTLRRRKDARGPRPSDQKTGAGPSARHPKDPRASGPRSKARGRVAG